MSSDTDLKIVLNLTECPFYQIATFLKFNFYVEFQNVRLVLSILQI